MSAGDCAGEAGLVEPDLNIDLVSCFAEQVQALVGDFFRNKYTCHQANLLAPPGSSPGLDNELWDLRHAHLAGCI